MLQRLFIQNYAIIDELSIEFSPKLNVITGETGAGKSIIVGALGLILGERADNSVLVNKEKKCVVEGVFIQHNKIKEVDDFLSSHDFEAASELIIRREISNSGKSRAFINDTPVTVSELQLLTSILVDLHRQFDSLDIGATGFQREVIDALAAQQNKVDEYHQAFSEWQTQAKEIDELKSRQILFEKETDYNQFQFNELSDANFTENELEDIEKELKLMQHAEEIKAVLDRVYFDLSDSETPIVQQLKVLFNQLNQFSSYHTELPSILQRLHSAQVELHDIAGDTLRVSNHIYADAKKINDVNERLSLGYRLQKKHGVHSTRELLDVQSELEEKLKAVLHIGEEIAEKEKQLAAVSEKIKSLAIAISSKRNKQTKPLETSVNQLLSRVGMPNARLRVNIETVEPGPYGIDKIEFLFNANTTGKSSEANTGFQPVRKVASGGELSRLMLCIKSLIAESIDLATLIFDEIDTGISGEAARQVGIIMKELAAKRQVLCITHQPQIASNADAHYFVYKEVVGERIKTNIRRLSVEERITAIAKMLGGEKPSAAAIENAREMVGN